MHASFLIRFRRRVITVYGAIEPSRANVQKVY